MFNNEHLLKNRQQPYSTLFTRTISRYTLGDDLFPCRLMFVQAVITPTPCVKEICCFATLAGCKPLTLSFCGWKILRRFSKWREKTRSNVTFVFLLKLQQFSSVKCVQIASGLTEGGGRTCLVAMESVSLHQLLSVRALPRVTNR